MRRIIGCCVWLALALIAAGCGGSAGTGAPQHEPGLQPGAGGAFGMPVPAAVLERLAPLRAASGAVLALAGKDFDPYSAQHVTVQDTSALFEPAWTGSASPSADFACAVYWFNLQDYAGLQTLQLTWSNPPEDYGNLWLGFSYWGDARWDWRPGPENGVLQPAGGLAQYTAGRTGDLLVAVVLLGNAPCTLSGLRIGASLAGGWRMYGHDAQHTHRSEFVSSQTGKLKWQYRTTGPGFAFTGAALHPDGTVYAGAGSSLHAYSPDGAQLWECLIPQAGAPVYNGHGLIYAASGTGYVYAVTTAGEVAWRFGAGTQQFTALIAAPDGACYFGSDDGFIYARDANGNELWTYATGSKVEMGPELADDGTLYFGCLNKKVYSMHVDGTLNWTYSISAANYFGHTCAVGPDGTLYVTSFDGLLALDQTGLLKWQYVEDHYAACGAPVFGPDGTLYFDNVAGELIALAPENEVLWTFKSAAASYYDTAVGIDGLIYCSSGTTLYVLNSTAELQWSYAAGINVRSPALRPDGGVYLSAEGYLFSLSAAGNLEWQVTSGGAAFNAAFDHADTAYIYSTGGNLDAINPDGSLRWSYRTPGWSSGTPAVGHDGTVYFGDCESMSALADDGSVIWRFGSDLLCTDSPVLSNNDGIYFGSGSHSAYLYSLHPSGTQNWASYVTGEFTFGSPALGYDGTSYIAAVPGFLMAYHPDGTQYWFYDTWVTSDGGFSVGADGTIYTGGHMTQSAMLAISPGGSLKWAYDLVGDFSSSTALSEDGVIYINWDDGFLYAINSDGSLKWTAAAGGRSSPAIGADGVVYAGGLDFRLHALNPDGTQLWVSAPAGGEFSDPAIANDGTLVVGCADGWIRAYGD